MAQTTARINDMEDRDRLIVASILNQVFGYSLESRDIKNVYLDIFPDGREQIIVSSSLGLDSLAGCYFRVLVQKFKQVMIESVAKVLVAVPGRDTEVGDLSFTYHLPGVYAAYRDGHPLGFTESATYDAANMLAYLEDLGWANNAYHDPGQNLDRCEF